MTAWEGGGGTQQMFIRGDSLRPEVQPLTLLCTIIQEKGTPFAYLLLTNAAPLSHTLFRTCKKAPLLTAVNALSFKQESITKIERFLDFIIKNNKIQLSLPFGPFHRPK